MTDLAFDVLIAAIGALLFGVALGWLIWGGRASRRADREGSSRREPSVEDALAPRLETAESEIKVARDLLAQSEDAPTAFAEDVSALETAINRANGRLKLIVRAVKKRAGGR